MKRNRLREKEDTQIYVVQSMWPMSTEQFKNFLFLN